MVILDTNINSKNINFHVKYNLYKSLILSILLYGCETWTITEREEKSIQAFENKAHRRLLCITYHQYKTNKYVQVIILNQIGKYEPLLNTIKRRKLKYFGHICRDDILARTILQVKIKCTRGIERPSNN